MVTFPHFTFGGHVVRSPLVVQLYLLRLFQTLTIQIVHRISKILYIVFLERVTFPEYYSSTGEEDTILNPQTPINLTKEWKTRFGIGY